MFFHGFNKCIFKVCPVFLYRVVLWVTFQELITTTAHRKYVDNMLNTDIKENPKRFHGYIKHEKSGTSNIPVLKPHTNILSEPREHWDITSS
jgi:hypothetical protein